MTEAKTYNQEEESAEIWKAPSLFPEEEPAKNDSKQKESTQQSYVRDPDTPDYVIPYYEQINNIPPPSASAEDKPRGSFQKCLAVLALIGCAFDMFLKGLLSLFGLYKLGSK